MKIVELDVSLQSQINSVSENFNAALSDLAVKTKEVNDLQAKQKERLTCCGQVQV